jgi:hypothetical protein
MSRFVHTDTNGLVHLTFLTSDSDSDAQRNVLFSDRRSSFLAVLKIKMSHVNSQITTALVTN